ncbi:MAG TPA: hypothetical protein VIA18_26575 [Polyangia bacterium]|nr:hypothetical protein [Polyangia bacterium]
MNAARRASALVAAAIAVVVAAIYTPLLAFPPTFDDWLLFGSFDRVPFAAVARAAFWPRGSLFYRPLGVLWVALDERLFALDTRPHHACMLLLLTLGALCSFHVLVRLGWDRALAALAAIGAAAALKIELDPQLWLVGVYDVAGAALAFASFLAFLHRRAWMSAALFALALLTKESTLLLPATLLASALLLEPGALNPRLRRAIRALTPHALVVAVYAPIRAHCTVSLLQLPPDAPYRLHVGANILTNLGQYAVWLVESLIAYRPVFPVVAIAIAVAIAVRLLPRTATALHLRAPEWSTPSRRTLLVTGVWALVALLPVLFLRGHDYRYYLVHSLPPLFALAWLALRTLLRWIVRDRGLAYALMFALLSAGAVSSAIRVRQMSRDWRRAERISGTNDLMRRAARFAALRAAIVAAPECRDIVLSGDELDRPATAAGLRFTVQNNSVQLRDNDSATTDPTHTCRFYSNVDSVITRLP